jgi:hypothetical protein
VDVPKQKNLHRKVGKSMDATFPQITWRRHATGIDRAAACSFLLSAALTLTVYAADKLA